MAFFLFTMLIAVALSLARNVFVTTGRFISLASDAQLDEPPKTSCIALQCCAPNSKFQAAANTTQAFFRYGSLY